MINLAAPIRIGYRRLIEDGVGILLHNHIIYI